MGKLKRVLALGARYVLLPLLAMLAIATATSLLIRSIARANNHAGGIIMSQRGVDQKLYVRLNGARQWVAIRGQDRNNPVLLYLHGGPGGTISGVSYSFQRPWEEYFTVVQWDQRGFGRSAIDGEKLRGTVTRAQLVDDTIALIEHLRRKFHQRRIILVGHSWGSLLGAEVARRRPDLLHAYVGFGQVTGWESNFVATRDAIGRIAQRRGDLALAAEVAAMGDPPSGQDVEALNAWMAKVQHPVLPLHGAIYNARGGGDIARWTLLTALASPDIGLGEIFGMLGGSDEWRAPLIRSAAGWDFRRTLGTHFMVPMIFVSGRYDLQAPTEAAVALSAEICSPYTEMVVIDDAAHYLVNEQPGRLLGALRDKALPFAQGHTPSGGRHCDEAPTAR